MKESRCLNLCDQLERLEQLIDRREMYEGVTRIYIGSSFCALYALKMEKKKLEDAFRLCREREWKVTLEIGLVTEKYFEAMNDKVIDIIEQGKGCLDELAVNDYGTLMWARKNTSLHLFLGRLFFKDYRDPRYPDSIDRIYQPHMFHSYFPKIVAEFGIDGVEMDPVAKELDLSKAMKGLTYAVHTPYCYITTGQICEYASISKQVERKFRPNSSCSMECIKYHSQYQLEDGQNWYRKGRAIFFRNDHCKISGVEKIRYIVNPFSIEMKDMNLWKGAEDGYSGTTK